MIFQNRTHAGKQLAQRFVYYKDKQPIILALPKGGVPVGFEVAKKLGAPLDVIITRKISSPYSPEFGIGAIAEGDTLVLDELIIDQLEISKEDLEAIIENQKLEIARQINLYRNNKPIPPLMDRTVILVDDGLARGFTALAAILRIKKMNLRQIVFATPVCAPDSAEDIRRFVNKIICIKAPADFAAVGVWYKDFRQVTDEEAINFLKKGNPRSSLSTWK